MQAPIPTLTSITFQTSDKQAKPVATYLQRTLSESFTKTEEYEKTNCGKIITTSSSGDALVQYARFSNGLIGCLYEAYNSHHNVVLKPDQFWIAIMTQFSLYVNGNGEELRSKFVSHEGQKELTVYAGGCLESADYVSIIESMTHLIRENLKDESVRNWVIPTFTTTTPTDQMVASVVLMAAMQKYFKYGCSLMCGIPSVTLLGTPEDWAALAAKVNRLVEFDNKKGEMMQWHALLAPICEELVAASSGKHNPDFWAKVCHHSGGGSGPSYISGWVTAFTCFDTDGKWMGGTGPAGAYPKLDTSFVTSGLVTVPFKVDDNGTVHETMFIAGSHCVEIVPGEAKDTLTPRADWVLALVKKEKKGGDAKRSKK